MTKPFVALVMPRYARAIASSGAARAFYGFPSLRGVKRGLFEKGTSLGIRCFNLLLCDVLNARRQHGFTHFCMIHDDVCPDDGWLDIMLDELECTGADLLSAVVPIKNPSGCTSTAVDMDGAPWLVRRLTMTEVFGLPETFGLDDIPWRLPPSQLLVNTGLWLIRLDSGWMEKAFPLDNPTGAARVAPLAFKDHARIVQLPNGEYVGEDISEDWDWSRQLSTLGLKLMTTRKVRLYHERAEFHNHAPWGQWETDHGYAKCLAMLNGGWRFPDDVSGWLSEVEGMALAKLARDKVVLEIGSYCGRSTVSMAQTAQQVWAVDPFDGRATSAPRDTYGDFLGNLARYGVRDRVILMRGTSVEMVPGIRGGFDLAFIDGAHDCPSVLRDAALARTKLAPGGLLAFHDYRRPGDEGVTMAVDALLQQGAELLDLVETVAVVRPAA